MESDPVIQCNLFNEDKQDELFKFLHLCIDATCNLKGPEFRQFSNIEWTKEEYNAICKLVLILFQNPSCLYVNGEKMPSEYYQLPDNVQQAVLTCLRIRKSQLVDAIMHKYSCRHVATLSNFDWRLKYVMGSSKMTSIREPLLQLDLILKNEPKEKVLGVELNKEELDSMINAIEAAVN